jgi:hypothetical protein
MYGTKLAIGLVGLAFVVGWLVGLAYLVGWLAGIAGLGLLDGGAFHQIKYGHSHGEKTILLAEAVHLMKYRHSRGETILLAEACHLIHSKHSQMTPFHSLASFYFPILFPIYISHKVMYTHKK